MDQDRVERHYDGNAKKPADRLSLIAFSAVVSLMGFVAVISRWQAFKWWSKLDAVILGLGLVTSTLSEILAEKRGLEHLKRFRLSLIAYCLIMLAIILFAND
jgi:hypothetical protein